MIKKFGKLFTPSTIKSYEELDMTEIKISCGGGMGGSCWEVYTSDTFDLDKKFILIDTNKDKNVTINTNNIVQVRPVRIFRIAIRNDGNNNMIQKVGTTQDYYYLLSADDEVKVVNEYVDHRNRDNLKEIKFAN